MDSRSVFIPFRPTFVVSLLPVANVHECLRFDSISQLKFSLVSLPTVLDYEYAYQVRCGALMCFPGSTCRAVVPTTISQSCLSRTFNAKSANIST